MSRIGSDLRRDLAGLAGFVLLCFGISGLGSLATSTGVETSYPSLVEPSFNPPDWIFGLLSTLLPATMRSTGPELSFFAGSSN